MRVKANSRRKTTLEIAATAAAEIALAFAWQPEQTASSCTAGSTDDDHSEEKRYADKNPSDSLSRYDCRAHASGSLFEYLRALRDQIGRHCAALSHHDPIGRHCATFSHVGGHACSGWRLAARQCRLRPNPGRRCVEHLPVPRRARKAGDQAGCRIGVRRVNGKELPPGASNLRLTSMYRIARAAGQSRERRRLASHPAKVKPELMADGPSQVWTWDITKLRGPAKGIWFQLYVLIDTYSRFNPSWIISPVVDSRTTRIASAKVCLSQALFAGRSRTQDDLA